MRIIGLGNDLVDMRRIEKTIERHDERFIERVFTVDEIEYCCSKGNKVANFAKRFAAKEACAKALGTGIADGVFWKDMIVTNDDFGKPSMILTGGALVRLQMLVPGGMKYQIDLTITDEHPLAHAIVIISALSEDD